MKSAKNYWVVAKRRGGRAYARPVWGVWLDGAFHFDSLSMDANLERDGRVEIHLESGDEVVIVEGHATRLTNAALRKRFAAAYRRKYAEDPPEWNWTVRPRIAFGWTLARFGPSATRWTFTASRRTRGPRPSLSSRR